MASVHPNINRESWLTNAVGLMRDRLFPSKGFEVPKEIRISVGFPKGSRGKGAHSIGQCWAAVASADKHFEVFIHPELVEPTRILDVVAHEIAHVVAGHDTGHGKGFREIATKIGLTGKMTATVAGEDLIPVLRDYSAFLGAYPHASLSSERGKGPKKQGTRLLAATCPDCGYKIRVTQKWIDTAGLPTCPCGGEFSQGDEE